MSDTQKLTAVARSSRLQAGRRRNGNRPGFGAGCVVGHARRLLWSLLALPLTIGCGSAETFQEQERGDAPGSENAEEVPTYEADPRIVESELAAPGYQVPSYPPGPYGVTAGATIKDLSLLGWADPRSAAFDMEQAELVSLSSFYDPDGSKNIELLLFNAVAIWCGVCQVEYDELDSQGIYTAFRPRGLEIIGVLFEDADSRPPRYEDMELWSQAFDVGFPFVMDPAFKTGEYFDRAATPMNMLIDAKTMEILFAFTGYSSEIYGEIDRILTTRGR